MRNFSKHQLNGFRILITALISLCGGILFIWLHIPVPWFLGPMTAVLIGSRFSRVSLFWPSRIRDTGMIMVGYSLGLSFTIDALRQIMMQLPSIFLSTLILIFFSSLIAFIVSKISGIDYPTILTGSIPGGLSQMVLLAEETKGIDLTVVTFFQVIRQMMIFFLVPLYIFNPFFGVQHMNSMKNTPIGMIHSGGFYSNILLFAAVSLLCAVIGKKIKIPTSFLVGPIIGTAVLTLLGIHGPTLPRSIVHLSQFMIGTYIGLLLKPEILTNKGKIMFLAIISGFCLLLTSLGLSLLLTISYRVSYSTSYLSIAPGGIDQMGILAREVNADLSMVVGFQLFRLFFIFFVVPPLLKLVYKRKIKNSSIPLPK